MGHSVRLMPPEYVKPYVKSHKNDDRDAEAIAEAAPRPTMRFVPIKEQDQLDIQTPHRAATALAAAVGNGSMFAKGRDFAAWLGLVPHQVTTGGRPRLVVALTCGYF
jgi:transposase